MTDRDALKTLIDALLPCYEPDEVPANEVSFVVLHGGSSVPYARTLDAQADRHTVHRAVCIGNTAQAAREIATSVTDLVHGRLHDRSAWLVEFVSDPLEDRSDQSDISWSCTVEIHHYHAKSKPQPEAKPEEEPSAEAI